MTLTTTDTATVNVAAADCRLLWHLMLLALAGELLPPQPLHPGPAQQHMRVTPRAVGSVMPIAVRWRDLGPFFGGHGTACRAFTGQCGVVLFISNSK